MEKKVPQNAIRFLVARHGETRDNILGILQGQQDGELNALGLRQAAALAEALYTIPLDACYTSDLLRAEDTARVILAAGHAKLSPIPEKGLREWLLGELEGRTRQEVQETHPEILAAFRKEPRPDLPVPGGETPEQFRRRVVGCLQGLAEKHTPGQTILLVTHGAAMGKIFQMATGPVDPGNRIPLAENASLSILHYFPHEKAWELVAWNRTGHLHGLPTHETKV